VDEGPDHRTVPIYRWRTNPQDELNTLPTLLGAANRIARQGNSLPLQCPQDSLNTRLGTDTSRRFTLPRPPRESGLDIFKP